MKIDVNKYTNNVITGFTMSKGDSLVVNKEKELYFNSILSDIVAITDEHTIRDYDVVVSDNGSLVGVEIDIGYFNEDVADSPFVRLLKKCIQFEIHPANLTRIVFVFNGIWDEK